MKSLMLFLVTSLATLTVQAQDPTIADIARIERARRAQAQSKSAWTIRTEDIRKSEPEADSAAGKPDSVEAAQPAAAAPVATPDAPAVPATPDPVEAWLAETGLVRARLRDLTDRETAAQLQINSLTNQIFAPQSTQSARDQAQSELQAAQQNLQGIRTELDQTRRELQARELQGPPKK